jgi:prephenate dehydrogenase
MSAVLRSEDDIVGFERLGLIGCGLIGGSFALALRRAHLVRRIVGYTASPAATERAVALGVIDEAARSALAAVAGCDIVLLAVPVAATEPTLLAIRDGLAPGALVMDVGSTKGDVVAAARRALPPHRLGDFVPAHPMAGKEVAGVEHAEASLFDGRQVVLTPLDATAPTSIRRAADVWTALGSRVVTMAPSTHDSAVAAVSHLPHLLAFAFINSLAEQPGGKEALAVAGPGFRDFSRIAASNPAIWRDILLANREQLLAHAQAFRATLLDLEALIASGDGAALESAIAAAHRTRSPWRLGAAAPSTD